MTPKDAVGTELRFGDQVLCVDPGADLGLTKGEHYLVFRVRDAWTIEIAREHVLEQAVMAGRFILTQATDNFQELRAKLKRARKLSQVVQEPVQPDWAPLALAAGWTPPKDTP
jgi:hypothetical protein